MRDPGGNRDEGLTFEKLFERQSLLQGFYPEKNHLKSQRTYNGRLKSLPPEEQLLDYTVIDKRTGRVGYFDCKNFEGTSFYPSSLNRTQRDRALLYNSFRVPSGFVVFFRDLNQVTFYSGDKIRQLTGSSAMAIDGLALGPWDKFDVRLIMITPERMSSCLDL